MNNEVPMTVKTARHIDIAAVLAYLSGLSGLSAAISIPESNHTAKAAFTVIGAISFMSGLALRTFFNPTSPTVIVQTPPPELTVK